MKSKSTPHLVILAIPVQQKSTKKLPANPEPIVQLVPQLKRPVHLDSTAHRSELKSTSSAEMVPTVLQLQQNQFHVQLASSEQARQTITTWRILVKIVDLVSTQQLARILAQIVGPAMFVLKALPNQTQQISPRKVVSSAPRVSTVRRKRTQLSLVHWLLTMIKKAQVS